jgi:Transposase protein
LPYLFTTKALLAYKLLSSTFQLPSVPVLSAWLRNKQNDTGFETSLITALQSKVQGMCTRDKTCVLLIDEMSTKSNLYFNSAANKIIGFEDLGDGDRTRTVACSVLVFMVSGLATRWKQPLSFFFVGTSCAASKVKQLLYKCFAKTEAFGLNVIAIISDQGSNFYQLCNLLAVTIERPFFEFNGKPYFYLFDSPHLLKSIRNNLRKHVFEFDDQKERAC